MDEAVSTIQRDTRHYAKRQLTWFRADPEYVWLPADQPEELDRLVDQALARSPRCPTSPSMARGHHE